ATWTVHHERGCPAAARPDRHRPDRAAGDARRAGHARFRDAAAGNGAASAPRRSRQWRVGRAAADRHHAAAADRRAGGLGLRGDLPPQPRRPDGGIDPKGRLRSRLRGGAAGVVFESDARPGIRPGRDDRHPRRFDLGRARAGAGTGDQQPGRDDRLHHRERRLVPLDRGREPALPATGQGLHRLCRARTVDHAHDGASRSNEAGDPARDRAQRHPPFRRRDIDRSDQPAAGRAGRLPASLQRVSGRGVPDDGNGHYPPARVHARGWRYGQHHDRRDRDAAQPGHPPDFV
ncbi:MAG: Fumarylacetoacetate hydrolase family protein, partial [uncultured Thermomicrobiales bacterium]